MHCIRAMIGNENDMRRIADNWASAEYHSLNQNFGMIFLLDELFDDITELVDSKKTIDFEDKFILLNSSVHELLEIESRHCYIAYIETDYSGGYGIQSSLLYYDGKVIVSPSKLESKTSDLRGNSPVNVILRKMGVRLGQSYDEFEAIGLKDIRRMD